MFIVQLHCMCQNPIISHLLQEDLIIRNSLCIETIHPPLAPTIAYSYSHVGESGYVRLAYTVVVGHNVGRHVLSDVTKSLQWLSSPFDL